MSYLGHSPDYEDEYFVPYADMYDDYDWLDDEEDEDDDDSGDEAGDEFDAGKYDW
jgi:hypothetical protein